MNQINTIPEDLKIGYLITILLMVILVLLVVFVVVIYNKRKTNYLKELKLKKAEFVNKLLQEKLKKQTAIQQEREQFSSNLHDEIGAGISAIKLRIEFIKNINKAPDINSELDELLDTSQSLNTSMREMLWNLNNENANLDQFYRFIENYGHSFFDKTSINFTANYLIEQDNCSISFSQKKHLISCLKELFNNAYKHSQASIVDLNFNKDGNEIVIEMRDDGIGFSEKIAEGNGIKNIAKRMQQINGDMQIVNKQNPTIIQLRFVI